MLEKINEWKKKHEENQKLKEERKFERLIEENEMLKVQKENMELKKDIMIENKRLKENILKPRRSQTHGRNTSK